MRYRRSKSAFRSYKQKAFAVSISGKWLTPERSYVGMLARVLQALPGAQRNAKQRLLIDERTFSWNIELCDVT